MINLSTFAQDFLVWLGIVPSNGVIATSTTPTCWFLLEQYYYSDCICSITFELCFTLISQRIILINDNRFFLIRRDILVCLLNSNVESISFNYRYLVRDVHPDF